MKLKFLPYIIILVFALIVTITRYFLIAEWPLHIHLLLFAGQFVFLSLVWKVVEALGNFLDSYIPFSQQAGKRIVIQILISLFLFAPLFLGIIFFVARILPAFVNTQFRALVTVVFIVFITLINFISYFKYFFEKWKDSVVANAALKVSALELEKEKTMMQYHHLKNQVNPHFLFNTLSSLDGLIQTNPGLASQFVRHLAKVYRYVLEHKEQEVVQIETELNFIEHYISLLNIRYGSALEIKLEISPAAMERGIAMVTLQMLIDNAIKHNIVQQGMPLKIWIWDEGDFLHVHNNKQLRRQMEISGKQGLKQLNELYGFLTSAKPIIKEDTHIFEIILPLL
jgi:sensor histidine kinase YesM